MHLDGTDSWAIFLCKKFLPIQDIGLTLLPGPLFSQSHTTNLTTTIQWHWDRDNVHEITYSLCRGWFLLLALATIMNQHQQRKLVWESSLACRFFLNDKGHKNNQNCTLSKDGHAGVRTSISRSRSLSVCLPFAWAWIFSSGS